MWCGRQHYHIEPCGKGGSSVFALVPLVILIVGVIWVINHIGEILIALAIILGSMMLLTSVGLGCIIVVQSTLDRRREVARKDIPIISYKLYPELTEKPQDDLIYWKGRDPLWQVDQPEPSKRIGD